MTDPENCADCWYLQHGWYPGEAPREPDDLRDAARDADANARCKKHRAVTSRPSTLTESELDVLKMRLLDLAQSDMERDWFTRVIAQARAARPSPTCATCWHDANCEIQQAAGNYSGNNILDTPKAKRLGLEMLRTQCEKPLGRS